jgi:hypothetical protein
MRGSVNSVTTAISSIAIPAEEEVNGGVQGAKADTVLRFGKCHSKTAVYTD